MIEIIINVSVPAIGIRGLKDRALKPFPVAIFYPKSGKAQKNS